MDLRGFGLSDDDLRQLGYDVKRKPGAEPQGPGRGRPWPPGAGGGSGGERGSAGVPAAPKRWAPATRTWLTSLIVLVAVGWGSGLGRWLPAPAPVAAPDTAFSSGRALAQLVDVAQEPRPTGSPANDRVRTYLVGRLRSLGLDAEVRTATAFVRDSGRVRSATVGNVVARMPGTEPTGAILLTAPFDTRPHSPGAGDNGMGVASLLEVVRALRAEAPLRNDVVVLFADGEELGRLGWRAFAATEPELAEPAVVLSVEGGGVSGPAAWFETGPANGRLVELLGEAEPRPAAFALARSLRARAMESAASEELRPVDVPTVSFAVLGDRALEHQPGDVRARVSEASLQHTGRQALALTRALGAIDLRSGLAAPERVYLSVPRIGAVHYPRLWVLPTTLALLAFWVLAGLVLRGRRATRRGVAVGLAAGAAAVAAAAGAARTLRDFAAAWHPELGTLSTAFYEDGAYVLAAAALALGCGSLVYVVAKRWARTDELVFGGLALPLLYACWLAVTDPFAAVALQLPLAAALLGGAIVIVLGPKRAGSAWAWAALLLLAAVSLALAVPSLELLTTVWTFREATRIGAVMGLSALLLWPLMERLLMPRAWWTPLAATTAAAALLVPTLPALRDASEHPRPTTLVYLTDEPVIAPLRAPAAILETDGARTRSMAGRWLTLAGGGEDWARSWVGEPASGSRDPGVLLLGADPRLEVIGTAPVSELLPPRVAVTGISHAAAGRRVELAVRPGLAGEMTGIHLPDGAPGTLVGVGDARWSGGDVPVRSLEHWGVPPTGSLRVHVEVGPGDAELSLVVIEHHLRPRAVLGSYFFQRPDSLVANVAVGSDRVIQRTRVRLPLADPTTP